MSVTLKTRTINVKDNKGTYQSLDMFTNANYQEQLDIAIGAMDSKARAYESQLATNDEYYRMMAEAFNPEKDYAVGYYVLYTTTNASTEEEETKLYRFIAPHSAGPWNTNEVREVRWGDDYFLIVDNYNKCYVTNHVESYNGITFSYNYDGTITLNGTTRTYTYVGLMGQESSTKAYSSDNEADYKSIQSGETYTFYRTIKSGTKTEGKSINLRYKEFSSQDGSSSVNNGETITFGSNAALFLAIDAATTFTNYTIYISAVKTLETPDLGEPGFCAKDGVARGILSDISQDGWNEFFVTDLKISRSFNGVTITKNEDGTFTFNGTPQSTIFIPIMGCKPDMRRTNPDVPMTMFNALKRRPDPRVPYIVDTTALYHVKKQTISEGEGSNPSLRLRYQYVNSEDGTGSFTIADNKTVQLKGNCVLFLYIVPTITTINDDNEEVTETVTFNNVVYRFMWAKNNTTYMRPLQKTAIDSFARDQLEGIENFADGARGMLPAYYFENNYIDNRIQTVQAHSEENGIYGDAFVWITDPHLYWQAEGQGTSENYRITNGMNAPKLLKMIKERTNINKFFNGGDFLRGNTTGKNPARTLMSNTIQHYVPIWDDMYCIIGNHDWNNNPTRTTEGGQTTESYNNLSNALSFVELYSLLIKHQEDKINIDFPETISDNYVGDYYLDNEKQKIRYFFIGCPNGGAAYDGYFSQASAEYLKTQLLLVPTGYTVIILAHNIVGNADADHGVTSFSQHFSDLIPFLNAAKTGTTYSTYNPNNIVVNIACIIAGHKHRDYCDLLPDTTIPYVITECDYCTGDNRAFNSITEQAFDVVQISTKEKKIYFTRFGGCKRATKNELLNDSTCADMVVNYGETAMDKIFSYEKRCLPLPGTT